MYTLYKHWKSCKYAHGKRQGPTTHSYSWYLVLLTNIRSRYTQSSLQKYHHAHFLLHVFLSPNHQLVTSNSFTLLAALHCVNYTDSQIDILNLHTRQFLFVMNSSYDKYIPYIKGRICNQPTHTHLRLPVMTLKLSNFGVITNLIWQLFQDFVLKYWPHIK